MVWRLKTSNVLWLQALLQSQNTWSSCIRWFAQQGGKPGSKNHGNNIKQCAKVWKHEQKPKHIYHIDRALPKIAPQKLSAGYPNVQMFLCFNTSSNSLRQGLWQSLSWAGLLVLEVRGWKRPERFGWFLVIYVFNYAAASYEALIKPAICVDHNTMVTTPAAFYIRPAQLIKILPIATACYISFLFSL